MIITIVVMSLFFRSLLLRTGKPLILKSIQNTNQTSKVVRNGNAKINVSLLYNTIEGDVDACANCAKHSTENIASSNIANMFWNEIKFVTMLGHSTGNATINDIIWR